MDSIKDISKGPIVTFARAKREGSHVLVTMEANSGAGKTFSAILLGRGLVGPEGKLALLDTETGRGKIYADLAGGYDYGELTPPFTPERYIAAIKTAEAAGYEAIMLTVDASIKRSSFPLPEGVDAANLRGMPRLQQTAQPRGRILFGTPLLDAAPRWDDLAWLRAQTKLPLIIKGVMSPADACLAIDHGADGIVISNHGGRVLDTMPSALDMLPGIAQVVDGKVPLLIDGGIRRGTDVLKALALGASAVLVGRPQMHALAVAGMAGVAHALLMLRTELELAMAQTGCASLADIGPDRLFMRAI